MLIYGLITLMEKQDAAHRQWINELDCESVDNGDGLSREQMNDQISPKYLVDAMSRARHLSYLLCAVTCDWLSFVWASIRSQTF